MTPLNPLFARIVLQRDDLQQKTRIIIPQTVAQRNAPAQGAVLAVGPTADKSIKPGMRVIFGQHAGTTLTHEGKEYFVCNDEDIICEIKDDRDGIRKAA